MWLALTNNRQQKWHCVTLGISFMGLGALVFTFIGLSHPNYPAIEARAELSCSFQPLQLRLSHRWAKPFWQLQLSLAAPAQAHGVETSYPCQTGLLSFGVVEKWWCRICRIFVSSPFSQQSPPSSPPVLSTALRSLIRGNNALCHILFSLTCHLQDSSLCSLTSRLTGFPWPGQAHHRVLLFPVLPPDVSPILGLHSNSTFWLRPSSLPSQSIQNYHYLIPCPYSLL